MKDPKLFKEKITPIKDIVEIRPGFIDEETNSSEKISKILYGLKQEHVSDKIAFKVLDYAEGLLDALTADVILDTFGSFHGLPTTGRRGWENEVKDAQEDNLADLKENGLDRNPIAVNNLVPIVTLGPLMLQQAGIDRSDLIEQGDYLSEKIREEYQEKEDYDEGGRMSIVADTKVLGKEIVKAIIDHYSS